MAEPNRNYESVVSDLLIREKKQNTAKELLKELQTILPLQNNPYIPSGKFNPNLLLLYIIGMSIIGVMFIPVLDFYIGYIQKYVESKGMLHGIDYASAMLDSFYLIGTIIAAHLLSSYFGSKFLGRFSHCRNTKIIVAATILPAAVIIIYLQTVAVSSFSKTSQFKDISGSGNDGYLIFIMLQSILIGISGLIAAIITASVYVEDNMYHEQTGAFFDTVESPKYNIVWVKDFLDAFRGNNEQEVLRIIKNAEIDTRKKDTYNDGNNYFQIILKKLPYHYEYHYGYIQGCIVISVNTEGNHTVSDSWDFLFDKADKKLIDSLSWTIKKYV